MGLWVLKPTGYAVQGVTLEILDNDDNVLQRILDNVPIGDHVWWSTEWPDDLLSLRVTFPSAITSTISGTPPPTHFLRYRFRVVMTNGTTTVRDTFLYGSKSNQRRRALWRMPTGLPRFGGRDSGGDDWCSRRTYEWLVSNSGLVTRINDISGEHARDLGHQGHEDGDKIDIFDFFSIHPATVQLQQAVVDALSANPTALATVTSWVAANRAGLTALVANANVQMLFSASGLGQPISGRTVTLPQGWASTLTLSGILTVGGQTLNTGLGAWTPARPIVRFNNVHNNHHHITLTFPAPR